MRIDSCTADRVDKRHPDYEIDKKGIRILIVSEASVCHGRPIPYRKGETVSCLSWGSFTGRLP